MNLCYVCIPVAQSIATTQPSRPDLSASDPFLSRKADDGVRLSALPGEQQSLVVPDMLQKRSLPAPLPPVSQPLQQQTSQPDASKAAAEVTTPGKMPSRIPQKSRQGLSEEEYASTKEVGDCLKVS